MVNKLVHLFDFNKTVIYKIEGLPIVCFQAGMAIDADGSPRAYHPDNTGLDDLKHGGYTGNWWGVATSDELSTGEPLIQKSSDPAPGYYVSTTSLIDARYEYQNPLRYVDAEVIPYFVLPDHFYPTIELGDIAFIHNTRNGLNSFAIFADVGPDVGEGSTHLAQKLGIDNHPRYGGVDSGILYFIFEGTGDGNGQHLAEYEIIEKGNKILDQILAKILDEILAPELVALFG
ncbi:MAG TPA: glycoside hydrolase family 75 protein [Puia sp.]|nr:glycoside hydrolase family 75 protein [Puia sp.]